MIKEEIIKKYFYASNKVAISLMYLSKYGDFTLKNYASGHLGTCMSMNFILANLYYFLNHQNLKNQIVIGPGHAGLSLISNLWLNNTLNRYDSNYSLDRKGLNNLIASFGGLVRSEINPGYPETIYDGGELGYSLATSYGYALNNKEVQIVPCIIGDGEAETGTLSASWQLNKLIKTTAKVLPIINLNGLKMGSASFLSRLNDSELINYFQTFGYQVHFVDAIDNPNLLENVKDFQNSLESTLKEDAPLIIFKSSKGFTLPSVFGKPLEGNINVHKDPFKNLEENLKREAIKKLWSHYEGEIFDQNDKLCKEFSLFATASPILNPKEVKNNILKEKTNI